MLRESAFWPQTEQYGGSDSQNFVQLFLKILNQNYFLLELRTVKAQTFRCKFESDQGQCRNKEIGRTLQEESRHAPPLVVGNGRDL